MSRVLDELRAAERSRHPAKPAGESSGGAIDSAIDAARAGEALALQLAGADECARREADARRSADNELLAALQRKQAAEELALAQAQKRAQAEAAAESAAASRAHAERLLEMAARARVEAEERALADTKRREFAAAELTKAAQSRVAREQEATTLARQRAESERHAADLSMETARAGSRHLSVDAGTDGGRTRRHAAGRAAPAR
ncbi:MAG: hypothetical protein IPG34_11090 [Rhodocyclaceae bacterium]|nr:hypothetical protein [Rhodocyclaceae bacterium]